MVGRALSWESHQRAEFHNGGSWKNEEGRGCGCDLCWPVSGYGARILLSGRPWATFLTSLNLSFPNCKMG